MNGATSESVRAASSAAARELSVGAPGRGLFDDVALTRLRLLEVRGTVKGNILATYGSPPE